MILISRQPNSFPPDTQIASTPLIPPFARAWKPRGRCKTSSTFQMVTAKRTRHEKVLSLYRKEKMLSVSSDRGKHKCQYYNYAG